MPGSYKATAIRRTGRTVTCDVMKLSEQNDGKGHLLCDQWLETTKQKPPTKQFALYKFILIPSLEKVFDLDNIFITIYKSY